MMDKNSSLYYALKEVIVDPASQYMSEVKDLNHHFSYQYRRNISNLTRNAEPVAHRSIKFNFKLAASLIAAVITVSALGVTAEKEVDRNWRIETTETIDHHQGAIDFNFIQGDFNGYEAMVDSNMYFPAYIPSGFEFDKENSEPEDGYYSYVDEDGNYIVYSESGITASPSIDNEHLVREKVTIHGYEADLFYDYDYGSGVLLWREEYKVFTVAGIVDKSELIKVAESVRRRK
ncbi:MAG: DUF4367 domain-containing protein [Ruminococcus sp.]|nr:DUF4367 domain-containing protein [Ruminococcus sp.]